METVGLTAFVGLFTGSPWELYKQYCGMGVRQNKDKRNSKWLGR